MDGWVSAAQAGPAMLKRFGLRARLVLLVLLAVAPVFALFAYSAAEHRRAIVERAQVNLQFQALLAALNQQRLVEGVAEVLSGVANAPSVKDPHNPQCASYLESLQLHERDDILLGVLDLDGQLACHVPGSGVSAFIPDKSLFARVLSGHRFATGHFTAGREGGVDSVAFARPVFDANGHVNSVVFAVMKLSSMSAALAQHPLESGVQARVIDENGTVLAAYPPGLAKVGLLDPDPVLRDRVLRGHFDDAPQFPDDELVYALAPVRGVAEGALSVAISAPDALIAAAPDALLHTEILALLLMAALGAAFAWWMGNRLIARPARAILAQANQVTQGNLQARVASVPAARDELSQISLGFNRMAESLQTRQQALDEALQRIDQERILLRTVFDSMSEAVLAVDSQERFLMTNCSASALYMHSPQPLLCLNDWYGTHELFTLEGEADSTLSERPLRQALRGQTLDNWVRRYRAAGQPERILRGSARPLLDADGQVFGGLLVASDITALRVAEEFAAAQQNVLELIASGAPLAQALEAIVLLVEKSSPASLCSIWLVKDQHLSHGAAPHLPIAVSQATQGLPVGEGVGACGTSAFRKTTVIVQDCATDPLMAPYRDVMAQCGLGACWSVPVLANDGEVLATFAVYRCAPGVPQPQDQSLMAIASRLVRVALERDRAEAALRTSQDRFQELAQNLDHVFYNIDARTNQLLYVSPAYERLWGNTCQSLLDDPASYARAIVPHDRPMLALTRRSNRAGQRSEVEYRILGPDGQIHWIRDNSYPVFDAHGELERIVGTALDVSASKRADLALSRTHRALQMVSRSSNAINRVHDEAALLTQVCRVAVDMGNYRMAWVGYARHDQAKSIEVMSHAGHDSGYLETIALSWREHSITGNGPAGQALRTGSVQQRGNISAATDFFWRDAALARGYGSCIALPLIGERGAFGVLCLYGSEPETAGAEEIGLLQELADNLAFGIGTLRERLERRRSQEEARQAMVKISEQASLMDQAYDAIMVRDLDGRLRFWNKGAERLLGWRSEEVLGKTMRYKMYCEPEAILAATQRLQASQEPWAGELERFAKDGSRVVVDARWSMLHDEYGQPNGMLDISTDIRERKRAHEEILQLNASLEVRVNQRTAELAQANEQLEAFSYSVSHDLRSPLSAIAGFSNLLEKSLAKSAAPGDPQTERQHHFLRRISSGVAQMGELIDGMLLLAQVSRATVREESVDLSAMALELLAGYEVREPARVTRFEVTPGLQARGDPRLVRQVLDNLLGNAWKFTRAKDVAEISVGRAPASAGAEPVYVVSDNGAGFDMAHAEKLFGAFQRLHSAAEFGGTGIGLATVQRIVARHGGRVWAESAPGEGARFYFTLGHLQS